MTTLNIHQQLHAVFFDRQQGRRQFAGHRTLGQFHSLFLRTAIAAVVDGALREQRLQGADQRGALVFRPSAQ